jgi:hypothetical protein
VSLSPLSRKLTKMDKIKEKLERLRIEADGHISRGDLAEAAVKLHQAQLTKCENTIKTLNNKVLLLQADVDRAMHRADGVRLRKTQDDKLDSFSEALKRKIAMLETQLDEKEKLRFEAVEKVRNLELQNENNTRFVKTAIIAKEDMASKVLSQNDANRK